MGRGASYEYGGSEHEHEHEECEPYAKAKMWVKVSRTVQDR